MSMYTDKAGESPMNDHYFTKKPTSRPLYGMIKATLRKREYKFQTASGIFSTKKIDRGTELLIKHMKIEPDNRVLDLGCGYGVIGIVAASTAKEVVLTDINQRGAGLSRNNLRLNEIRNAKVKKGNLYEPVGEQKFDVILCNLPVSAGLTVVYDIINGSKEHLNPAGTMQVVIRKGAKRINEKLEEVFGNVDTLAKKGGYRVFLSRMPG